jgi:Asp-tRNA(Asn)/Glu-tRNA(Gln) amidotransferase A subunit family amidase
VPTPLHYATATDLLAAYAAGSTTPTQIVAALRARIAEAEGAVNALTPELLDVDAAVAESERRWAEGTQRPLEGLPVVLKEEQPIEGHTATEGSPLFKDSIAEETHPLITRIIDAGGIPFRRTTTPEFCIAAYTRGQLWGITRNPWNPDYAVGGSSGGSGAALAAGYAPLATGSDIGGSTRIPACFNGVVGYKPPFGRNAALPPFNADPYCTDGPMARTVADLALLQNVMAGQELSDPVSLPAPAPVRADADLEGRTVALVTKIGDYGLEAEVTDAVRGTRAWLEAAGATVEEIELPFTHRQIMRIAWTHLGSLMLPFVAEEIGEDNLHLLEPYTRQALRLGAEAVSDLGQMGGLLGEAEVQGTLGTLFERFDALVAPVSGTVGLLADDYYEHGITVAGEGYPSHIESFPTVIFNIANRCPVISVPATRSAVGVPIGVQVAARPYDDQTVFSVAAAIEVGRGAWFTSEEHTPGLAVPAAS